MKDLTVNYCNGIVPPGHTNDGFVLNPGRWKILRNLTAVALFILLSACGGGGVVGVMTRAAQSHRDRPSWMQGAFHRSAMSNPSVRTMLK